MYLKNIKVKRKKGKKILVVKETGIYIQIHNRPEGGSLNQRNQRERERERIDPQEKSFFNSNHHLILTTHIYTYMYNMKLLHLTK